MNSEREVVYVKKSGKQKRKLWISVTAGFMVTYLLTMGLTTYLVKEKYVEQYRQSFDEAALYLLNAATEKEEEMTSEVETRIQRREEAAKREAEEAERRLEEARGESEEEESGKEEAKRESEEEEFGREDAGSGDKEAIESNEESEEEVQETDEKPSDNEWGEEQRKDFYQGLVNEYFCGTGNRVLQMTAAVYDEEGMLLARSCDAIGDTMFSGKTSGEKNGPFALDEYLSLDQKEELAEYYWKGDLLAENYTLPEKYQILIRTSSDGGELYDIIVQEITWEEGKEAAEKQYEDPFTESISSYETGAYIDYETGSEAGENHIFYETDSKVVWEWENPKVDDAHRKDGQIQNTDMIFPRMDTYEDWHSWSVSEYLHGFPKKWDYKRGNQGEYPECTDDSEGMYFRCRYQLKVGYIDNPYAYMEIRMEENLWLMALGYMKYAFLAGLILAMGCIAWIICAFNKIYDRQAALEGTRRDITNAVAHELKTPLGIIRNFAENLMEHNMEEKRDYYLSQIIGQTEEMDDLVTEMIEIAKLDSEELTLKKEPVSFMELIQEQMERFHPVIAEKNLEVKYLKEADFQIDGDREYLARAVWNLLSNAVDHNVPDGWIRVNVSQGQCMIENSGEPMEEEQLLHAFDLFYTRDRSRNMQEKHLGLGLFLAKKILALHGLKLTIENTDCGVRVVMGLR